MTDAEAEALGRRLVACKGFRVMRGMLDMQGRTWGRDLLWRWRNDLDVPDLRDPATLGCVLALVREAWKDNGLGCICQDVGLMNGGKMWSLIGEGGELVRYRLRYHESEAEALVAALEAAP